MKGFFVGEIFHSMPSDNCDNQGNRAIVCHLRFGPIEAMIYGITSDLKFYFNHTFPEGLGEDDIKPHFKFITKDEILKIINCEMAVWEIQKNNDMLEAFRTEKENIENNL